MLFALLTCIGQVSAQWERYARITQVLIWNADGTYAAYKCSEQPTVMTDSLQLMITFNDGTLLTFPSTEVRKFTFDDAQLTPVEQLAKQATFDINQQAISVTDLKAGAAVMVYDSNGRLMAKAKAKDGKARVNISNLRRGVYVVKAGSNNFKFLKR